MKKTISFPGTIILISCTLLINCVRLQEKTTKYPNGNIQEKYQYYLDENKMETKDGAWTKWYENGQKSEESNWIDGTPHGVWVKWYENGNKQEETNWLNGVQIGLHKKWYQNAQLRYQGTWSDGFKKGLETRWYQSGKKKSETEYRNGKISGSKSTWDEEGNLFSKEKWELGDRTDITIHIPKDKIRTHVLDFSPGKPAEQFSYFLDPDGNKVKHGIHREWYSNGNLERELTYLAGHKDGKETWFYETGARKSKTHWKSKKKHGSEWYWFENGKPKSQEKYVDGVLNGETAHWYENGNKKFAGVYVDNELEGKAEYWHERGTLKSRYEYEHGKLSGKVIHGYPNGNKKSVCTYANGVEHGVCTFWYQTGQKKLEVLYRQGTKLVKTERKWDESGKEFAKNNASLIEKVLAEEKIIEAARSCKQAQTLTSKHKKEMESSTPYMELQKKELLYNSALEEETQKCKAFETLLGVYKESHSTEEAQKLSEAHQFPTLEGTESPEGELDSDQTNF